MTIRNIASKALALTTLLFVTPAIADDLSTIRFAVGAHTTGAQIWVAEGKGFFEENKIKPEITTFATGVESIDAVLTGRADMAVGLDFPTVLRIQSGQISILASLFASRPGFHRLMVGETIQSTDDLHGKRFGIVNGTAQHLITVKYLEKYGVGADDAEIVQMTSLFELLAALKSGDIDGSFLWADALQKAHDDGFLELASDAEAELNQYAYLIANKGFVANNFDATVAALKAMDAAADFLNSENEASAEIIAKAVRAPRDSVSRMLKLNEFSVSLTDVQRSSLSVIAEFASKVIDTPVTFDSAVDLAPLTSAVPENVQISN